MALDVRLLPDVLRLHLRNSTALPAKLWELHNSWGWESIWLELTSEGTGDRHAVRRKPRDWTKNGPTFFVLEPGSHCEIDVAPTDGWWDLSRVPPKTEHNPLAVRVCWRILPSPEAEELGIAIGTARSAWVVSRAPHRWLLAQR